MSQACLSSNLRRTERLVTRLYDSFLADAGVTAAQLPILALISALPSPSFRALSEELVLERSTLSRNLSVMQRNGLVKLGKSAGPIPGRISLTPKGREILGKAYKQWIVAHEHLVRLLSSNSLADALHLLQVIREGVKESPR